MRSGAGSAHRESTAAATATGRRGSLSYKLHNLPTLYQKCVVAIARALRDADAPPHIVLAVAEACASVNARPSPGNVGYLRPADGSS